MTFAKILSAAAFGLVTLTSVSAMAAGNGKLIAIITPSHDNRQSGVEKPHGFSTMWSEGREGCRFAPIWLNRSHCQL